MQDDTLLIPGKPVASLFVELQEKRASKGEVNENVATLLGAIPVAGPLASGLHSGISAGRSKTQAGLVSGMGTLGGSIGGGMGGSILGGVLAKALGGGRKAQGQGSGVGALLGLIAGGALGSRAGAESANMTTEILNKGLPINLTFTEKREEEDKDKDAEKRANLWDNIKGSLSAAGDGLKEHIRETPGNAASAISSARSGAMDHARGAGNALLGLIPEVPGGPPAGGTQGGSWTSAASGGWGPSEAWHQGTPATTPAAPAPAPAPAAPAPSAPAPSAPAPSAPAPAGPDDAYLSRVMGSYNPNSSRDQAKAEAIRQAWKQNGGYMSPNQIYANAGYNKVASANTPAHLLAELQVKRAGKDEKIDVDMQTLLGALPGSTLWTGLHAGSKSKDDPVPTGIGHGAANLGGAIAGSAVGQSLGSLVDSIRHGADNKGVKAMAQVDVGDIMKADDLAGSFEGMSKVISDLGGKPRSKAVQVLGGMLGGASGGALISRHLAKRHNEK